MRVRFHPIVVMAVFLAAGGWAQGQSAIAPEVPQKTTVCELIHNPTQWNRKLVEVTGFASHGFEDSGFSSPECDSRYAALWMTYGGTSTTQTKSVSADQFPNRAAPLKVDGIVVPLVEDATFHRFDKLLQGLNAQSHMVDNLVHATVVARFFAKPTPKPREFMGGYGHMGCCSLFAIQQVLSVQELPDTLDTSGHADYPQAKSVRFLTDVDTTSAGLRAQQQADRDGKDDAFTDPDGVAWQALAGYLGAGAAASVTLQRSKSGTYPYRVVYEGVSNDTGLKYRIVVSRPAWLSFYATDPARIVWVVIGAFEYGDVTGSGPKVEIVK